MATSEENSGALVGEKSQTVHSANWKLDAMLKREKQMLDISKRRVEHRITMDKQVVRKRFHIKLHRSRLHHARMTGNTEMLQKLLAQGSFDNNYGAANDESPFLSAGCSASRNGERSNSASARLIRAKEREMRATVGTRLNLGLRSQSTLNRMEEETGTQSQREKRRVKTAMGRCGLSSVDNDKSKTPDMAATSHGEENKRAAKFPEGSKSPNTSATDKLGVEFVKKRESTRNAVRIRPVTADLVNTEYKQGADGTTQKRNGMDQPSRSVNRPKTAPGKTKISNARQAATNTVNDDMGIEPDVTDHGQPALSAETLVKSASRKELKSTVQSSSIFNEKPKVTLLDVQRNRILRANFPKRIKVFTKSIPGHLKVDKGDLVDIYTADLLHKLQLQQGKDGQGPGNVTRPSETEGGALISDDSENEEQLRCIGNIYAPNMTFKSLNTNYDHVKSECVEPIPFQRKSSGLAGILRHKSISKLSIPSTAWESDEDDFD